MARLDKDSTTQQDGTHNDDLTRADRTLTGTVELAGDRRGEPYDTAPLETTRRFGRRVV